MQSEKTEADRRLARVQQWLGAVDICARHESATDKRFAGTGDWLLENHRFQRWFSPDQCVDPLLWLHGMPGAGKVLISHSSFLAYMTGKTILASLIIERARKLRNASIVYFYCRDSDEQHRGFLTVARSFLSQMLMKHESILNYLYEKAAESSEAVLSTTAVAKELLAITLNSCKDVYVVLDGLDEYSRAERKDLTSWFIDLISSLARADFGSIRCLFISQEDGFARKDLSMLSQIKITPSDNKADIEAFCQHWHKEIEDKFGCLEGEHHVKNVVSARAQGAVVRREI